MNIQIFSCPEDDVEKPVRRMFPGAAWTTSREKQMLPATAIKSGLMFGTWTVVG